MENNNEKDVYYEDNSFNNQGMEMPEQDETAFNNYSNNMMNFGKGFIQGVKDNSHNNPALGQRKSKEKNNNSNINDDKNKDQNNRQNTNADNRNNSTNNSSNGNGMPGVVKRPNNAKDNGYNKDSLNNKKQDGNNLKKENGSGAGNKNSARSNLANRVRNRGINKGIGVGEASTGVEAAATGTRSLITVFKMLPLPVKIGIIVAVVLLFVFLLILLVLGMGASSEGLYAYGSSHCAGESFDISDLKDTSVKTYTGVFWFAWDKSSGQYKFYSETPTYVDDDGFLRTGTDYIIALGTFFGTKKGTRYLIELENGTTFTAALGDTKSDAHTDPTHRYHVGDANNPGDGSVIEFEMGCGNEINPSAYGFNFSGDWPKSCDDAQDAINKKFPGNIKSIKLLEDDENCNYNGLFRPRVSSIYLDSKAISEILEAAPGVAGNYYTWDLTYQCVTYAKLRGVEILMTNSVLTEKQTKKALQEFGNAQGNGWSWTAKDNPGLKNFGFDPTCSDFRAGSVIAWNGSGAPCLDGPIGFCGHVAIIESVNPAKKEVIISDGYNRLRGQWHAVTYSYDEAKAAYNGCRGITHLLNYNG